MDTKKYFDDPQTIVTSTDIESLAKEVESHKYMEAYVARKEKFIPRIDFTTASNFAFFGSAEQYYDDAIKRIYKTYPYDGSLYEKTAWHFSSSFLDEHIFEQEYPRTNGFIRLAAKDQTHPYGSATTGDNDYRTGSAAEYILFRGGPHPSKRSKGKKITDTSGDYKSGYSNFYDQSKNRESNLKIDGKDGNTVEFWMKKASTPTTREVIFDTYTANAAISDAGYGRLRVELEKDADKFRVTYMSGNADLRAGYATASIGQGISFDDSWHHYAFTFKNETPGKSVLFDGSDDYIELGPVDYDPWNDSEVEYSVSFWFRRDSKPSSSDERIMFNGADSGAYPAIFSFALDSDGLLKTTLGTTNAAVDSVNYCDGEWHHVVLVVYQSSGAKYKVYVNGALAKSATSLPGAYTTPTDFRFAKPTQGGGAYYGGYLDEITIWNTDLSATEVAELYNETGQYFDPTTHSKKANLANWWDMGETRSNVKAPSPNYKLLDRIGGNHGQMNNFGTTYGIKETTNFGGHLRTKFYLDGVCKETFNLGNPVSYVSGGMYATIGALATTLSGNNVPQLGWAPLSASLDEFRFWKTARTEQQIGRHWFTQVGGGTNTDDANTHLGVYYKFNEGITGDDDRDSVVLDYSGRLNNGEWVGYTSGHRSTDSAIVLSNLASASYEFKDPILYPSHPDVDGYLTSSLTKGKYHDLSNNASIYLSLPNWVIDEDAENGFVLKKLMQIMASYFDTLQLQIQSLPSLQNVAYPSGSQQAHPFIRQALESKGFVTSELFSDATILEQFLNQTDKELFEEKLYNVKNQIYQNIYNSLTHINKTKGTTKSFRNLIRCFGIDDEILKLNMYGNRVDYFLEDGYVATTVKKNCIDFNHPSRYQGTIYQSTSSMDSLSFISGSRGSYKAPYHSSEPVYDIATPFTTEAEFIFPKRNPPNSTIPYSYVDLSASLFGMHTARQASYEQPPSDGEVYNDFVWHDDDRANFQVYACRKTHQHDISRGQGYTNKEAFFQLTSSQQSLAINLTSSVFANVYDGTKWNFAVRVLPNKYPLAGYVTGTLPSFAEDASDQYRVEFYGVNTNLDVVSNEFMLTGTISKEKGRAFLSSSKRVYAGSHRTNFTGSTLTKTDVKFSSLRCWLDYLDDKTIQAHSRDPKNIGRTNPYKNASLFDSLPQDAYATLSRYPYLPQMETLILNWDCTGLTGSSAASSESYYGSSTKNGSFIMEDMSSGSVHITSSYGWASEVAHMKHPAKGDFFLPSNTGMISKEYIYSARQALPENLHSENMINIVKTDDVVFTRQTLPTTHFFAIEKSMYQTISEEMLRFFATIVDFNNLIGEPINRYRQDYKTIAKLRQLFFLRKTEDPGDIVNPDFEKYIDYYRWVDQSISKMIQQIIPASGRFSEDIRNMVESHILERNKYWSKLPIIEEKTKRTKHLMEAVITHPPKQKDSNAEDENLTGKSSTGFVLGENGTGLPGMVPGQLGGPSIEKLAKSNRPVNMVYRLPQPTDDPSESTWEKDKENSNTLAWISAKREEPAITTSGRAARDVDSGRKAIFDATINTLQRMNRMPIKLRSVATQPIHGGVNNLKNKKLDLFKTLITTATGSEKVGLEITTGSVAQSAVAKEYKNLYFPETKKREFLATSRLQSRGSAADTGESDYFGDSYSKWAAPFTFVSSSVKAGYKSIISTYFTGGVDFANLHQDVYGPHYEVPMQGPFTEKWVGGWPHRHVWSQFSNSAGSNLDDVTNRVEGWRLVFKEDTKGKYVTIVSPNSSSVHNPRSMFWHGPKRPVNIENIQMTTGSGGYKDPNNTAKIGNYRFDYNIISTTGRKINNRYFVENQGIDPKWQNHQKPNSWVLPIMGVSHFTTPDRAITGSNDFVFVNRFNAPGGPETMCESFLDLESGEYSLYNCLNYRNLSVRLPLREYLTNHSNKFGFWSDTQYSASAQTAIDSGLKIARSYIGYAATATIQITDAGGVTNGDTFTLTNAAGLTTTYLINGGGSWDSQSGGDAGATVHVFIGSAGGGDTGKVRVSSAINAAINATTSADFTSTTDGTDSVTVTQTTIGADGNKNNTDSISGATVGHFTGGSKNVHATQTSASSNHYRGTNTLGQPMRSFHNVHRNSRKRTVFDRNSSHTTITGTVHDNYWVQHPIPRTDLQYSWITASIAQIYSGEPLWLYGYEQKNTNDIRSYRPEASTTLQFLTASDFGSWAQSPYTGDPRHWGNAKEDIAVTGDSKVDFLPTDFVGMNYHIYEPITASQNILGYPSLVVTNPQGDNERLNASYINQTFLPGVGGESVHHGLGRLKTPAVSAILNSIIHHRQGPYGWPSWKQVRMANHPIARHERKNNILSYVFDKDKPITRFTESFGTSRYKPIVHVFKEGAIEHTYGNNLVNFANVELRDRLKFDLYGGDQVYDHLKNLYLGECLTLRPELISLYYREALYPREINVYLKKARTRENYNVDFWRDTRAKRTEENATNSQGQTISKQSMWPLDAREDFDTAAIRTSTSSEWDGRESPGNNGAGELLNNYTIYLTTGSTHPKILPSALYARPISGSDADTGEDVVANDTKYETGNPFYGSYEGYSEEIRKAGQNYSIVSEFRISEHMEYYLDDKNGDFFADREGFLTCTGSSYADSTTDNFFKTYSHTDFLKYFNVIYEEHEGVLEPNKVTFICNGIMKLLPYKGFYPADRTLQLATLFSQSYGSTEFVGSSDSYSDNAKRRISLAPFFAPGILYNSIKSGIAVDYPIYTKQPGSTTAGGTVDATTAYAVPSLNNAIAAGNAASANVYRLSSSFDTRLPFDSLVRPEHYIGNGKYIYEAEPDPTARLSGSTDSVGANAASGTPTATGSVKLDLVKSDKYKLAMHNFLATTIDFFLKNGEVSTLISGKNDDVYVVDKTKGSYKMRYYLSDHQDVSATHDRTFSMYNRQSAFGPTVNAPHNKGGYAPFTPPYYYNDTKTGYSYVEYSLNPSAQSDVADKFGTFATAEWTLDEILSNCTVTAYRSADNSQTTGSSPGNNYVQDINMMNLTASITIFQKDAHLIAQPKWETPMHNFTRVTKTSPSEGVAASTKGNWHQKGTYETDNTKGIFFGALDVEGAASLADLLQVDKGLKKIGILPDDNEKVIREAVVAIPVIKKYNNRTKRVETRFINVNKNMVKRAVRSFISGQSPEGVTPSVFHMVKTMSRYVIPPKFDFLTQLKKFGSKRFRPFAMYFFEFEHEFSQEDISNIWQNLPPAIGTSFKKEKISIAHTLQRGELLTAKELKNPDLHWMVFKVKQKAKWNYFDKVIDLAGQLPPRPDAGHSLVSVQLGSEVEAPLEGSKSVPNPWGGMGGFNPAPSIPNAARFSTIGNQSSVGGSAVADIQNVIEGALNSLEGGISDEATTTPTQSPGLQTQSQGADISPQASIKVQNLAQGIRNNIDDIVQYARQESDVASGYGLEYSYNWPYDFCSLVELVKLDTEVHLGGGEPIQVVQRVKPDGTRATETVVVSGRGARRAIPDDIREEAPLAETPRPEAVSLDIPTGLNPTTQVGPTGQAAGTAAMLQEMIRDCEKKMSEALTSAQQQTIKEECLALKQALANLQAFEGDTTGQQGQSTLQLLD